MAAVTFLSLFSTLRHRVQGQGVVLDINFDEKKDVAIVNALVFGDVAASNNITVSMAMVTVPSSAIHPARLS